MLELFQYKSQIRVLKTVLVATGFFAVFLCKESGWSSTTAEADEVVGHFSFAFASWFLRWFFVWFFGVTCSTVMEKVAHNPHIPRRISTRPQSTMKPPSQGPTQACSRNIQLQYEFCLNESSQHHFSDRYGHEDSISGRPQRKEFSGEDLVSQTLQWSG